MLNKIAVAFLMLLVSCPALHAQIQVNKILLGGQVNYEKTSISYSTGQKDQSTSDGTFTVSVGKAFKTNAVAGVTLGYTPASLSNYFNGSYFINGTLRVYSAGIFYRQYKMLAKDFYFFTEAGAGYSEAKQTTGDSAATNTEVIRQYTGRITLMPGLAYKISKRLHLEIVIPNFVTAEYAVITENLQSPQQAASAKQHHFLFNSSLNSSGLNFLGVGFHFEL